MSKKPGQGKGCGGGGSGSSKKQQGQQEEEEAMAAATAARVPIPAAVRRTIQNIKEIAGGHTDEEVYAALRECNMDPNETAQKLLLQDTFHEVKRKRDKKKESNKEPTDSRWNQVAQGRGGKGGRGNYSSRQFCNSSDLTGRTVFAGKENELNLSMDKWSISSPVNPNTETRTSTPISSLSGRLSNGPSQPVAPMEKHSLASRDFPFSDAKRLANQEGTPEEVVMDLGPDVSQSLVEPPPSIPGVCSSVSTLEVTSRENNHHGEIVVSKHAFRGQKTTGDYVMAPSSVLKDTCWPSDSSSIALPSGSRPSSSYSSCSQQLSGLQKVVPNKEWKPKSTYKPTQAANITCNPVTVEVVRQSYPVSTSIHKEDISSKVGKMLGDMQFLDKQHVIIPDHLQVTESEKYGLSFGSFGTSYKQTVGFSNDHKSEKSFTLPEYESSREVDEVGDGYVSSHQGASSAVEAAAEPGPQQPTAEETDNISPQEVDTSSSTPEAAESDQSKDTAPSHIPQDSVQNTPSYSTFSVTPQSQGNQMPLLEVSEYQVQPTNNFSANYYTQLYRPIADVDGYQSPFTAPGAAIKSGNMSILPGQTVQTQEEPNSLVLSSSGSTPLPIPAPGTVPSSVAIPQQPLPVFRQPVGVHLPHYQPSFIPYNQYISPFYVPQHAVHHFMGNAAFPHAPSAIYPPVSSAGAPPVKYSATTYKPGAYTGSQTHAVTPGAYGTYASSPPVFTNNNVVVSGTSAENRDVSGSQFKENNIYIAGQQSEGSTVWIPAPGRELSALQSSSFYGLPPQGQHLAFAPAQVGHGAYGGMYHPAQTLPGGAVHPLLQPSQTIAGAVEMVGPPASGYQQPQHAQMNWGSY